MSSIQWLVRAYNFAKTQEQCGIPFSKIHDLQYLGCGTEGTVYKATLDNVQVVVKRVNDSALADIRHLTKLRHRNVIKFEGISRQSAGQIYIVMEYCPFGSLYDLVRMDTHIPPAKVADWSHQIASGMRYLHQHNIIHRDLKSPNILITNYDTLKISDFGSHTINDNNLNCSMSYMGTISWMAPEVILNKPTTFKVDVWSYGVVLWELMTCEIPFKSMSTPAIILGLGTGSIRLPIPSTFPSGYRKLLNWCWRLKPSQRPTFEQILVELKTANEELQDIDNGLFHQLQKSWKSEIDLILDENTCMTRTGGSLQDESHDSSDRIRIDYEHKLKQILDLYIDLQACWLQLGLKEEELLLKEKALKQREAALEAQLTIVNGNVAQDNTCI